jgi:hypothetical protein
LLDNRVEILAEQKESAPLTDEDRKLEQLKNLNALYCNLYKYIKQEPIEKIVIATALAAYNSNPSILPESFHKEQNLAFQELMLRDFRCYGVPNKELSKNDLLTDAK